MNPTGKARINVLPFERKVRQDEMFQTALSPACERPIVNSSQEIKNEKGESLGGD